MSDRKLLILIAAVILVVGGVLLVRNLDTGYSPVVSMKQDRETVKRTSSARATMTDCRKVGDRIRVDGLVHNLGTTNLSALTVQTIWKDENGNILDTGIVYAIGENNPLKPGGQRAFSDTTALRSVKLCNVRALDWWASDAQDQ